MINLYRHQQFQIYNSARNYFITSPDALIDLEKFVTNHIVSLVASNLTEIKNDYNEASYLYPFWENYPPEGHLYLFKRRGYRQRYNK